MKSRCWLWVFVACLGAMLCASASAHAQELTSGWEGYGPQGYGFVSPVFSFGLHRRRHGPDGKHSGPAHVSFILTGAASYLYYTSYQTTGPLDVRSPGISFSPGVRLQSRRVTFTLTPGYEVRWTQKTPTGGPTQNVIERGVIGQAYLSFQANPLTNLNTNISYEDSNHYFWGRGGLIRQVTDKHFTGPVALSIGAEVTGQGNSEIRSYEVGPVFEISFLRSNASLQFRSGYSRQMFPNNSSISQPYFGVGIYRSFGHGR